MEKENFETHNPLSYELEVGEFQRVPQEFQKYTFGDRVTRENFNSFIIESFRISRGDADVHCAYFELIKKLNGFDFRKTFENFKQAGGWDVLSKEEQVEFMKMFDRIKGHAENDIVLDDIKDQLASLSKVGGIRNEDIGRFVDISKINTLPEFVEASREYHKWFDSGH